MRRRDLVAGRKHGHPGDTRAAARMGYVPRKLRRSRLSPGLSSCWVVPVLTVPRRHVEPVSIGRLECSRVTVESTTRSGFEAGTYCAERVGDFSGWLRVQQRKVPTKVEVDRDVVLRETTQKCRELPRSSSWQLVRTSDPHSEITRDCTSQTKQPCKRCGL
jgi:hypothetical protein